MIGATRSSINAEIARQSSLAQEIAKAQTQVSTQKRLQADSDDPAAAARIATIRREQANRATYGTNLDAAAAIADRADATLDSVSTATQQAIELVTRAGNGTLSASDRQILAGQLSGIADDVASYMATKDSSGNPLFPTGAATQIPVADGVTLSPTASSATVFGGIATGSGTSDLVSILRAAASAVSSGDASAISASLTSVNAAADHIGDQRGLLGVQAARIDAAKQRLTSGDASLAAERSGLEDTDLTTTVAKLQSKLLTLEAAQATFAQLNKQTLFDKLS